MTELERLAELQRELTAALRVPERADRLALYRRQSWQQQLAILRQEHRLVAALLGPEGFDDVARRFLLAHPPRGHTRAAVCDGFDAFMTDPALSDAVRVDRAFQQVVMAGPPQPCALEPLDTTQLVASPAVALVDERWPLVALRRQLLPTPDTRATLPRPHAATRTWLLAGKSRGVLALPVVAPHAHFLRALAIHPIGEALAQLDDATRAEHGQSWLRRSLALGMWCTTTS